MSLSVNYPDKIIAGVHQSYTITSEQGQPSGTVTIDGQEIPHRVIRLGAPKESLESTTNVMKYKVTFLLPEDAVGKTVNLKFQAGAGSTDDVKEIVDA